MRLLFVVLFTIPTLATAVTADELRMQIQAVLNRIEVVQQQIAEEEARLQQVRAQTTIPTFISSGHDIQRCIQISFDLERGARGQSIIDLQNFLVSQSVYSAGLVTGYFGPATEAGVKRFQAKEGIVSYGTPFTTGYGRVGPSTRRAMNAKCTQKSTITQQPIIEKYSLSVNPQNGGAPHKVQANFAINGSSCTSYSLDWGDGSFKTERQAEQYTQCEYEDINRQLSHTYTTPGTYTVVFKTGRASLEQIQTVARVVIHVSDMNLQTEITDRSFTLSKNTGKAPESITTSFIMNGSSCTSYLLDWGDNSSPMIKQGTVSGICTKDITKRSITHTYVTPGTYTISLKIGQNSPVSELRVIETKTVVIE